MCINMSPISMYRLASWTILPYAEWAKCKGDRIREWVYVWVLFLYIDLLWMSILHYAELAHRKGDRIRGCVPISNLYLYLDFLWMISLHRMPNQSIVKEIGVAGCVSIWDIFLYIDLLCLSILHAAESSNCKRGRIRGCLSMLCPIFMYRLASLSNNIAWCT